MPVWPAIHRWCGASIKQIWTRNGTSPSRCGPPRVAHDCPGGSRAGSCSSRGLLCNYTRGSVIQHGRWRLFPAVSIYTSSGPIQPPACLVRRELEIPKDALIIGMASRFHPQKDHQTFIQAAARLRDLTPKVHFLLCGRGVTRDNAQLCEWIAEAGIQAQCHLLGERRDTARLFAAMDIATSSSASEAFPLAVGEGMACGTPCVVTNVGDSALLVGETGTVVAPGDPVALAGAWRDLIEAGPEVRRSLGIAARRRVQQHFDMSAIVERYQAIYARLAGETLRRMPSPSLAQSAE